MVQIPPPVRLAESRRLPARHMYMSLPAAYVGMRGNFGGVLVYRTRWQADFSSCYSMNFPRVRTPKVERPVDGMYRLIVKLGESLVVSAQHFVD